MADHLAAQKSLYVLPIQLLGLASGTLNFCAFADKRPLTWHRIAVFYNLAHRGA